MPHWHNDLPRQQHPMARLQVGSVQCALLWTALLLLCSCVPGRASSAATPTATTTSTPSPTATVTPTPILVSPDCHPPSPIHEGPVGPEVQGTASPASQQLWGLLFLMSPLPLHAHKDVKIVWRMTGGGGLQLIARGPQGQQLPPEVGPTFHRGSNWTDHPGEEWGSGFNFPVPGCWDIRATRDDASGDVLLVLAA